MNKTYFVIFFILLPTLQRKLLISTTAMSKSVLLGGGYGFIGRAIKTAFEEVGYTVNVITREPPPYQQGTPRPYTWEEIKNRGLPEGTKFVINAAGENALNFHKLWTKKHQQEIIDSRVGTNKILAEAIDKSRVKPSAFLSLSGVGIYPPDNNSLFDEYSEVKPFDFFSELVYEWERATNNSSNVRTMNFRSGVVLGKDGGMIKQIKIPFQLNLGTIFGTGKQPFPWIHITDLVSSILHCLLYNEEVKGPVNSVAPDIITNEQFSKAFAGAMSKRLFLKIPSFALRFGLGNDRSSMLLYGPRVNPKKLREEANYRFIYPTIKSAMIELLPEYLE